MSKTIKFGVIGCGNIALGKHAFAFYQTPEAEVVCVCDLVEEKAKTGMEKMQAKEYYLDAQKMLDEADIDAVLITTPHPAHAALTLMAAKAKKHIIVEKPAAVTLEELDQMIAAAKENGVKLLNLPVYHSESFYMAKEIIEKGTLGEIINIDGATYNDIYPPEPWYLSERAGFGATADLGIYSLAPLIGLFGKPDTVMAYNIKASDEVPMNDGKSYKLEQEDTAKVVLSWGDKRIACISAAWQGGTMRSGNVISGRKGTLVLEGWGSDDLYYTAARTGAAPELSEGKEKVSFQSEEFYVVNKDPRGAGKLGVDYLVKAINEDVDLSEDYQCARDTLEVILKSYESVKAGAPVKL